MIGRAETILHSLEKGQQSSALARLADDLPLFAAARPLAAPPPPEARPSPVLAALTELNPDHMTPRDALDALYRLKTLLL